MNQTRLTAQWGLKLAAALSGAILAACGGVAKRPAQPAPVISAWSVFAEGPCPKLSIHRSGERRFIVYGDTGYDLHAWLPGEPLAAAQAIAEVKGDRVYRSPALLAGLPRNARGYVRGELELGGAPPAATWLHLITARYSSGGQGALFERRVHGYSFVPGKGWASAGEDSPAALPFQARKLPTLPSATMCPKAGLTLVPLASTTTAAGGVFVAGRCDDEQAPNYVDTTILVAHGRPDADRWEVAQIPDADALDGIVNLALAAPSDDRAYLVAYEPFTPREERQSFFAHYDGSRWRELPLPIDDGLMSVAAADDGTLWFAAGRALYQRQESGEVTTVPLPPPRFARGASDALHLHRVRAFGQNELWVEASYRLDLPAGRGAKRGWASALFTTRPPRYPLYCDANQPAETALYEVE